MRANTARGATPAVGRSEHGAASVLILTVIATVLVALMLTAVLASGQAARRQAAAAADLAAIAAASQLEQGVNAACAVAESIAVANGGALRDCLVDGLEVEVQVRVPVVGAGASWLPPQDRRARAGP